MGELADFDPADPDTWPFTHEGADRLGRMVADEFHQILGRFVEQRVKPVAVWVGQHGGDPLEVLHQFAGGLRRSADAIEGDS